MRTSDIVTLLRSEVLPTYGCTEPGAVALACAQAAMLLEDEDISGISVEVNPNVYKNGVAVGIPGTGETGLLIAAALGAIKQHPERQLSVLAGVSIDELEQARLMLRKKIVHVSVDESKTSLWIKAVILSANNKAEVIISEKHTNIISMVKNGTELLGKDTQQPVVHNDLRAILKSESVTIASLIKAVEKIDARELEFLMQGVKMNYQAAQQGIDKKLGMGIGAALKNLIDTGVIGDDLINNVKMFTAAAADARMSGENVEIMSSAGSGNHGITVILPVVIVGQHLKVSQEDLIHALAISHLLTIYIKIYTGNLSALCGCAVAAASGSSAAITWLMTKDIAKVEATIKNIIANITGIICDGGKVGCALKLANAAAVAVESSLLAQNGIVVPDSNGIIAETAEETILNLGKVSNPGMVATDGIIIDIMLGKKNTGCKKD